MFVVDIEFGVKECTVGHPLHQARLPHFRAGLDPVPQHCHAHQMPDRSHNGLRSQADRTHPWRQVTAACLHASKLALSLIASVPYWTLASDFGAARTPGEECVNAIMVESGSGRVTSRTVSFPVELLPKYTTIQHTPSRPAQVHPIFVYVIGTCMDKDDLNALRATFASLSLLPPNALVGLITFGTMAQTQQLGHDQCPNSSVFRGTKEYAPKQIQEMLGLTVDPAANVPRPDAQTSFSNTRARVRRSVTPGPGLSSRAPPLSPLY